MTCCEGVFCGVFQKCNNCYVSFGKQVVPEFLYLEGCTKLALSPSRVALVLHPPPGVAHPLWGHKNLRGM